MAASFLIFLAIVIVIIIFGGGVAFAISFKDAIFGSIVLLVGFGLIVAGLALLVKIGGGVGAFGIFLAFFGAVITWFGQSIIRDTL